MAEKPKNPPPASAEKKAPAKKTATVKKTSAKSADSKKSESKTTKKVGGGTKTHPVSAERIKAAEDAIKSKSVKSKSSDNQATIELKNRAAEAKKRAQEKILDKAYVSDPADPLERLANTFDNSARRWEMVVYPSMFAFILLAGYGFFLIYHLTTDISILSKNVSHMASIVSDSMPKMSQNLNGMTGSINNMTSDISSMSNDVNGMTNGISKMSDQMTTLRPMNANLANMTNTMNSMNRSVYGMQRDMGSMNRTVSSGPFGVMNDMMPFSSNSYKRPTQPPLRYYPPTAAPSPKYVKPKSSARPVTKSAPEAVIVNKNSH